MEHFPEYLNDVEFTESLVTEQSVFCLPAQVIMLNLCIMSKIKGHLYYKFGNIRDVLIFPIFHKLSASQIYKSAKSLHL